MSGFVNFLETVLTYIVQICIILMEFAGVCVLAVNAVRAFFHWATRANRNLRLELAHGIALALEFKMGGEVLRTVVVREWSELLMEQNFLQLYSFTFTALNIILQKPLFSTILPIFYNLT